MADRIFVRIPPASPCEVHVADNRTFRKEQGWIGPVPEPLAKVLAKIPQHVLRPNGPRLFEVKTEEEALAIQEREERIEDPRGTVQAPKALPARAKPSAAAQAEAAQIAAQDAIIAKLGALKEDAKEAEEDAPVAEAVPPAPEPKRSYKRRQKEEPASEPVLQRLPAGDPSLDAPQVPKKPTT